MNENKRSINIFIPIQNCIFADPSNVNPFCFFTPFGQSYLCWQTIFPCSSCEKAFKSKREINFHMRALHGVGRKPVCETCGKEDFRSLSFFKSHRQVCKQPGNVRISEVLCVMELEFINESGISLEINEKSYQVIISEYNKWSKKMINY